MSTVVEEQAPEGVAEETQAAQPGVPPPPPPPIAVEEEPPLRILRPALGAGLATSGAAFLVGGMFAGFSPRVYAILGTAAGVLLAVWAARATKRQTLIQILSFAGIGLIGIVFLLDPSSISRLPDLVGDAIKGARLRRPPVAFEEGWKPILGWTMGAVAYAAAWIGIEFRRPATGVLIPIPVMAFAAIAQPPNAQVVGGIVAVITFVIALAIIFRPDYGEAEQVRMPRAYEMRRALRTAPFVIIVTVGLVAMSQANLLFPAPVIDPTQRAIKPRAIPLSDVPDRVLFTVRSSITGPWRTGVLDVYDGTGWALPPYSQAVLKPIPETGVIDPTVRPGAAAHFKVEGLEGTVLPTPPRSRVIVGSLPALVTDDRTKAVRVQTGEVRRGLEYDVAFPLLPDVKELERASPPPPELREFTQAPLPIPPGIQALIDRAPRTGSLWTRLDKVREIYLGEEGVAASGSGLPVEVPPSRVEEIWRNKEGTPFEIVASQALIARWMGVPARIGYGFDLGEEKAAGLREFRPKHGSLWLEVWFSGQGWLPVTGLPAKAKQSAGGTEETLSVQLIPTDDIAVSLFIPLKVNPSGLFFRRLQQVFLIALPIALLILLVYTVYPAVVKARRRSRRRAWAQQRGPRERIAVAYTEFRDAATDLGAGDPYATPLAFLDLVVPDEEHLELAWLVTRAVWGDLRDVLTPEDVFAAEELSRSLRRRMFEAQPITIRVISWVSRLSLRQPYGLPLTTRRTTRRAKEVPAHVPA